MENKTCENCKWCAKDKHRDTYCVNSDSEHCTEYVDTDFSCTEWEEGNEYNMWKK